MSSSSGHSYSFANRSPGRSSLVVNGGPEYEYEGVRYCDCGMKAPRWLAWTENNVGRRFYSCRYYEVFFLIWVKFDMGRDGRFKFCICFLI